MNAASAPKPDRWSVRLTEGPELRRILIMKWSAMGDVVIATAAMADIAAAFPRAEIHVDVSPPWDRLFRHDARIARILAFAHRGRDRGPRGVMRWVRTVRAAGYDAIFDLQSNDHSRALITAAVLAGARVPHRVGFHRRFPYNVAAAPPPPPVHAMTYARELLLAAGITPHTQRPSLVVPDAANEGARRILASHGLVPGEYAVFLPGCQAAGYLKRWGARRYAALARRLTPGTVARVVLLGGPDEIDECAAIAQAAPESVVDLCGQTELMEVVPLSEGARFIVANDTGTAHLASAAGRPMRVICGPTDPRRVKPPGSDVLALQADLACVNCYRKQCAHHACMAAVTPAMVEASLEPVLRGGISSPD